MARTTIKNILDMDDRTQKRRLLNAIGALTGIYEVRVKPRRNTRSLAQQGWYFSCIVPALADFLAQQDYERCSEEFAHAVLKEKFLTVALIDRKTGEVLARPTGSTAKLDTQQFSDYCEKCRHWLMDQFGIEVQDPDPFYSSSSRKRGKKDYENRLVPSGAGSVS